MDKQLEFKYIAQLNLKNLKRIPTGYMCSCPKCNEGNSPWKTRLYILTEKKSYITVYCHNCTYDTNLRSFIKEFFPHVFESYKSEERNELLKSLKEGNFLKKDNYTSNYNQEVNIQYKFKLSKTYFKPAKNYKEAIEFCKRRNIIEHIDSLYYNIHPNHTLSGMIIFPFYLEDGKTLYGFQGRHTQVKRFHTHSKNEFLKVYNIFDVDLDETVYIFESIIDSMMMKNSIAMLGTTLSEAMLQKLGKPVYICDNDFTGKKKTLQYLKEGKSCFIPPNDFKYKDFNEAVCNGINKSTLPFLVKENTYKGIDGITRITFKLMEKK